MFSLFSRANIIKKKEYAKKLEMTRVHQPSKPPTSNKIINSSVEKAQEQCSIISSTLKLQPKAAVKKFTLNSNVPQVYNPKVVINSSNTLDTKTNARGLHNTANGLKNNQQREGNFGSKQNHFTVTDKQKA